MGSATPLHRRRSESYSITLDRLGEWLRSSKPGDRLTYAHGPYLVATELAARVRGLIDGEEVHHRRYRADDGAFDYVIIRNRVRVALPPRPRRDTAIDLDAIMSGLFLLLKATARRGERCPSDSALAQALGVSRDQVKWALRKLVAAGLVASRVVPAAGDPKYRVVTVVATGRETALPEAMRDDG
ncbi:MAG TPA: GntR family transcriptional regulator [Sphingomicrobium sp.]|nr:GntR family transcriptional regulator [Sphingomicrobium sp.]